MVRYLKIWKERLGVKVLEGEILRDRGLDIERDIRAYRFRKRLWVRGFERDRDYGLRT